MIKYLNLFLVYLHLVQSTPEVNNSTLLPEIERNVTDDKAILSFGRYHPYQKIAQHMQRIQKNNKKTAKKILIGKSFENRDIYAMLISSNNFRSKNIIVVDAGLHGREWSGISAAVYLITQMMNGARNKRMYKNFDWVIIPSVNPDGYEYSRAQDRSWRKTTSVGKFCFGVDANRNFAYKWGRKVSRKKQCEQTYKGPIPFSESETKAVRDYVKKLKPKIKLYISLHAKGRFITHPWSWSKKSVKNKNVLVRVANIAAEAMKKVNGITFKIGSSAHMLGKSSGNSMDYFYKTLGVEYCFAVPVSLQSYKVPPKKLRKRVEEAFAGVKALWQQLNNILFKEDESIEIN